MLDPELLKAYNAVRSTPHKSVFCHAPFASVNFAQSGDATVCCYNRTYVLGTYPTDSLDEIWHGTRAREIRDAMSRNALPRGCDICLSQFWSGNFAGLRARSFDHLAEGDYEAEDGRLLAFPKLMEFEISNVCNLECTMCSGFFSSSIRHNREKLPPLRSPYDDAFVRQLEPFIPHLTDARFLGGEPFLIRTYYQIWDMIARLNPEIDVSITTNATILNDRVKGILENIRASIVVSIDSLNRETYERIRLGANYDQVMANLEYFVDYSRMKGRSLSLAVCPMRQNWRELPEIVDFCNARGIQVFFNTVVFPGDAAFQYMTHRELDDVVTQLQSRRGQGRTGIERHNEDQYRDLVKQIAGERSKSGLLEGDRVPLAADGWELLLDAGHAATVRLPRGPSGPLEVIIGDGSLERAGGVRLRSRRIPFRSDQRYVLEFCAQSSGPQRLTVGAEQGTAPDERSFYLEFGLTSVSERFEGEFVPQADDENGAIVFEVGNTRAEVLLDDITLRVMPAGAGSDVKDSPSDHKGTVVPLTLL